MNLLKRRIAVPAAGVCVVALTACGAGSDNAATQETPSAVASAPADSESDTSHTDDPAPSDIGGEGAAPLGQSELPSAAKEPVDLGPVVKGGTLIYEDFKGYKATIDIKVHAMKKFDDFSKLPVECQESKTAWSGLSTIDVATSPVSFRVIAFEESTKAEASNGFEWDPKSRIPSHWNTNTWKSCGTEPWAINESHMQWVIAWTTRSPNYPDGDWQVTQEFTWQVDNIDPASCEAAGGYAGGDVCSLDVEVDE